MTSVRSESMISKISLLLKSYHFIPALSFPFLILRKFSTKFIPSAKKCSLPSAQNYRQTGFCQSMFGKQALFPWWLRSNVYMHTILAVFWENSNGVCLRVNSLSYDSTGSLPTNKAGFWFLKEGRKSKNWHHLASRFWWLIARMLPQQQLRMKWHYDFITHLFYYSAFKV